MQNANSDCAGALFAFCILHLEFARESSALLRHVGGERGPRDPPRGADLSALQIAGVEHRHHVGLGDAERLGGLGGAEQLRKSSGRGCACIFIKL